MTSGFRSYSLQCSACVPFLPTLELRGSYYTHTVLELRHSDDDALKPERERCCHTLHCHCCFCCSLWLPTNHLNDIEAGFSVGQMQICTTSGLFKPCLICNHLWFSSPPPPASQSLHTTNAIIAKSGICSASIRHGNLLRRHRRASLPKFSP